MYSISIHVLIMLFTLDRIFSRLIIHSNDYFLSTLILRPEIPDTRLAVHQSWNDAVHCRDVCYSFCGTLKGKLSFF